MDELTTVQIQHWLERLGAGDETAAEHLIHCACRRLEVLAHKSLKGFPGVHRWEQTSDVFQNAAMRLHRALKEIKPDSPRGFFQLASKLIRRELIDLLRHYHGPMGAAAHQDSLKDSTKLKLEPRDESLDPAKLAFWTQVHERIGGLPDEEREVFELTWYQDLTQAEVAQVLGISERTVKRRWREARLRLRETLSEDFLR